MRRWRRKKRWSRRRRRKKRKRDKETKKKNCENEVVVMKEGRTKMWKEDKERWMKEETRVRTERRMTMLRREKRATDLYVNVIKDVKEKVKDKFTRNLFNQEGNANNEYIYGLVSCGIME